MLNPVRQLENELMAKCNVVRIDQKENFDRPPVEIDDFGQVLSFYIIPNDGGRVLKVSFGYSVVRDFLDKDPNLRYFLNTDSLENLKKYNLEIPQEFLN